MNSRNVSYIKSLKTLLRILNLLSRKRKYQLLITLFLMIISSFAEVITIGSLLPFLEIILNDKNILDNTLYGALINYLFSPNEENVLFFATILFIFLVIIAASIRLLNQWINIKLSAAIGSDISIKSFSALMYKDYNFFLKSNSSTMLAISSVYINYVANIVKQFLTFLTSSILSISIIIGLLIINFKITSLILFLISFCYLLQFYLSKNFLNKQSKLLEILSQKHIKVVQESYASIREIIIDNSQRNFINEFSDLDISLRRNEASMQFFQSFPKYIIECIGLVVISSLCFLFYSYSDDNSSLVSVIGTVTLGLQKLLPLLFAIYSSWAIFKTYVYAVNLVLNLAEQYDHQNKYENNRKIREKFKELDVRELRFSYKKDDLIILDKVSFNIKAGDRIAIIGETGSGKSTLIDLLMGIITPDSGEIFVNSKNIHLNNKRLYAWRSLISHVPQDVFLKDASISENIAFGIQKSEINYSKLEEVIEKARLKKLINKLPKGYETFVGERGINLSGGQKQRIGIARALYKDKKVIFLDEATSALDRNTEKEIIDTIKGLDKEITVFLISHKISSLKFFNKFLKVENSNVYQIKNIEKLI